MANHSRRDRMSDIVVVVSGKQEDSASWRMDYMYAAERQTVCYCQGAEGGGKEGERVREDGDRVCACRWFMYRPTWPIDWGEKCRADGGLPL